jgi:MoaA/NifB/PqqE/SkfB family radical SAM enzyme
MRPDLMQFLELAKQQALEIVLITNGWFLDRGTLDQLESIGVDRLMVSLNSLDAVTHDETRGKPGSHERVMKAIEAWRARPGAIDLSLSTVVVEGNCGELTSLARFAENGGLSGIIFQVLAAQEAHYPFANETSMPQPASSWYTQDPRWVRRTDLLRQQVHELLQMQRGGSPILNPSSQLRYFPLYYEEPDAIRRLPCLGTLSRMYIDPFGDIRVCYGYPPVGNVLHDDPRETWRGEMAQKIRRDSRRCTQLCRMLNNSF